MIQLNSELTYDTELSFEEQLSEVKQFINEKMESNIPIETFEPAGVVPRVILQEWDFSTYKILKQYYYQNPPESDRNGIISGEIIKIKEV